MEVVGCQSGRQGDREVDAVVIAWEEVIIQKAEVS